MGAKKTFRLLAGQTLASIKPATRRKAQKSTQEWHVIRREIPEALRKWEQKAKYVKERAEVAKWSRRAPSQPMEQR